MPFPFGSCSKDSKLFSTLRISSDMLASIEEKEKKQKVIELSKKIQVVSLYHLPHVLHWHYYCRFLNMNFLQEVELVERAPRGIPSSAGGSEEIEQNQRAKRVEIRCRRRISRSKCVMSIVSVAYILSTHWSGMDGYRERRKYTYQDRCEDSVTSYKLAALCNSLLELKILWIYWELRKIEPITE